MIAFDLYITSLVECSQCTALSKGNKKPVHAEDEDITPIYRTENVHAGPRICRKG
jgi:hypothetical protein